MKSTFFILFLRIKETIKYKIQYHWHKLEDLKYTIKQEKEGD